MRRTVQEHGPHPIDVHVGNRVRQRRSLLGLSQNQLAETLGITFQQIQKNERGTNRIASSRLFQLSCILDVPVSYFFQEMPLTLSTDPHGDASVSELPRGDRDNLFKRKTLQLVRAYFGIKDEQVRRRLKLLVEEVGSNEA
ncbi:MAG: helix-turn-helix transcriptional regulator [Alphaproteobacteria bacterium]